MEALEHYIETILRPRAWMLSIFFAVCWILFIVEGIHGYLRRDKVSRWILYSALILLPLLVSEILQIYLAPNPESFLIWGFADAPLIFLFIYCLLKWEQNRSGTTIGRNISILSSAIAVPVSCIGLILVLHSKTVIQLVGTGVVAVVPALLFIVGGEIAHHVQVLRRRR
jgi:hypothetical protein